MLPNICPRFVMVSMRADKPEPESESFQPDFFQTDSAFEGRLDEIQRRYGFQVSEDFSNQLGVLDRSQFFYSAIDQAGVSAQFSDMCDRGLAELNRVCALALRDARVESFQAHIGAGVGFVELSVSSPHSLERFGSFFVFVRLLPLGGDVSYATRCYAVSFTGVEPVLIQDSIPLPPELFLDGASVVDEEGSLRPDALTSAPPSAAAVTVSCEVYLGTRKLLSRELAVEPVSLYGEFRDFQQ